MPPKCDSHDVWNLSMLREGDVDGVGNRSRETAAKSKTGECGTNGRIANRAVSGCGRRKGRFLGLLLDVGRDVQVGGDATDRKWLPGQSRCLNCYLIVASQP